MCKVLIFAGTTEGVSLCDLLTENRIETHVCVATEYGSLSYEKNEYLKMHAGRLTAEEMTALMKEIRPEMVLDATHPYAAEVTENIRTACKAADICCHRVLRDAGKRSSQAVYVESTEEAVSYLKKTQGNILLTTGSKELAKYTELPDHQERIYARVLSLPEVIKNCSELGITGKHLIGMQGPFSKELNEAMIRQYDCKYLVTKDTGKAGGFEEKAEAAYACGAVLIVIGRPMEEKGLTLTEARQMLADRYGFELKPEITIVGIGMGTEETLTVQGKRAIEKADLLIGARRMVDAVRKEDQDVLYEYRSEAVVSYIKEHPEYEKIAIVLSGDVGFYSGARKLLELLGKDAKVICGISSVAYFMSKIGSSWEDARLLSAHGRECNLISEIKHHEKTFAIMGTQDGIAELSEKLVYYGMGDVLLYVGENLSYKNEKIFSARANELTEYQGDALSVVCAWNSGAETAPQSIADEAFIRGKAPMTKGEVRTVSLSKLQLSKDSVCYDVGAGTGSVSVEMARRACEGSVYAIEKKEDAAVLIEENKRRFAVDNLHLIKGTAPDALAELPAPTHVFIGGSSGNLREIVQTLLRKNQDVRIVINCITLETVSEAVETMRAFGFAESEIVQIGVARAKELGRYHMMMGENPIYVMTCQHPTVGEEQDL